MLAGDDICYQYLIWTFIQFCHQESSWLLQCCQHVRARTHTHTHALTHNVYLFIDLSLCHYTPISCMLPTLGRNHETDVTSSIKQPRLNLTLQEETSCLRPSWSALLEFLISCLWDIFLSTNSLQFCQKSLPSSVTINHTHLWNSN